MGAHSRLLTSVSVQNFLQFHINTDITTGVPSRHATPLRRAFSSCPPFSSRLSTTPTRDAPSPSCPLRRTLARSPTYSRALSGVLSRSLRRTLVPSPSFAPSCSHFPLVGSPSLVAPPSRWVALALGRPCVGSPLRRVALASPFRRVALASHRASLVALPLPPLAASHIHFICKSTEKENAVVVRSSIVDMCT
jgi:hypothetical protein